MARLFKISLLFLLALSAVHDVVGCWITIEPLVLRFRDVDDLFSITAYAGKLRSWWVEMFDPS